MYDVSNYLQVRKTHTVCVGIILFSNLSYSNFTIKLHHCKKRFVLNGTVHALYVCTINRMKA